MSRIIQTRPELHNAKEITQNALSPDGRLIIYHHNSDYCIFHIKENRLISIKCLSEADHSQDIILARVVNIKNDINAAFVKLDENTDAFLKLTYVPKDQMPLKQGVLIPVRIKSDKQKGKLISVTGSINRHRLPEGWEHKQAYNILYRSENSLKDYIDKAFSPGSYGKIMTEDPDIYEKLVPGFGDKTELYKDDKLPLSKLYSLKTKLSEAFSAKAYLKCGGYLVINRTEALTVIDVNSGKNTPSKKADRDAVTLSLNLEASEEIAHQIKLRNISGMILVDFINMETDEDKQILLEKMEEYVSDDTVKVNVIDITPLGIMEITRQKTDKPVEELHDRLIDLF